MKCAAFAGGGSGGHIYPLIAVAEKLKNQYPDIDIYFVSKAKSVESGVLSRAGFKTYFIPSGKLNGQSILKTLWTCINMPIAFLKSALIVVFHRPEVVMSAGGYAGAPFLAVASTLKVPCCIYEQNRKPGMANRMMARFAKLVLLNFPATINLFPRNPTAVVGHPCRPEISAARIAPADRERFFSDLRFRIFVFGGSQGAVGVNRLILDAVPDLKDLWEQLEIQHQTGEHDFEHVKQCYKELGFTNARIQLYVHEMASAYHLAHLVVCRAGASSLIELAAAGKAAVLIPLVSKDGHQIPNAQELVRTGAALTLDQEKATGKDLAAIIQNLFRNRKELAAMSERISSVYTPDAEAKIVEELVRLRS